LSGKYRILSVLGTGSSGTVYLAEHLKLKIYRAIKCIPKVTAHSSSFPLEEPFYHEANLLKNLNHPGIPLIYDIDEDDDFVYMIEEFIQGESLENFVLHHEDISQELIIKSGIQLCDILDYLHHLAPCPILHQDLKPEHIILCGNQLKIIDFGIASFFTGSGKHFQIYGTKEYAAPEVFSQLPNSTASDIYSLGRVLEFVAEHAASGCSPELWQLIREVTAEDPNARPGSAADIKTSLIALQNQARSSSSHLIRNIAVIGSRTGVGATHIAIALATALNKCGSPTLYMSMDAKPVLEDIAQANYHIREQDGIYYYNHFKGIPDYGDGISSLISPEDCIIQDFGCCSCPPDNFTSYDLVLLVLGGSDWDFPAACSLAQQFSLLPQTVYLCNLGNKKAARKLARQLHKSVYCFPFDPVPYQDRREKDRLISAILHKKGGTSHQTF
jgi:serine/threonine-protein kinase